MALTKSQILEMGRKRTEGRATSLDHGTEFLIALQTVCLEKRWWWRKKILPFTLQAGISKYQLLDTGTNGMNAPDFQQVTKNGLKIFAGNGVSSGSLLTSRRAFVSPTPVFDDDAQETILATQQLYNQDVPTQYFIQGDGTTLVLDPIPDGAYPASLAYWAVPQVDASSQDETIPLIPVPLYGLLLKRYEMQLERFCSGEDPTKYKIVAAEYQELLAKAQLYSGFAEGQITEWKSNDQSDAVQSS